MPQAFFCGCTARFVSDQVENPEDRFSHNEAHLNQGSNVVYFLGDCKMKFWRETPNQAGYTTLNIHEIWLRLFRGDHLLYIRAKMTSFVNSHDWHVVMVCLLKKRGTIGRLNGAF